MELSAVVLWVGWTWIMYRVGKRNGKREVIRSTADEPASDRNGWFVETRVPYDEHYVTLVGEAVYIFLYYEWAIICVLDYLEPGFRLKYCRGSSHMTSGRVSTLLKTASENYAGCKTVEKAEMESCSSRFESAMQKRNALIHATPITSDDGSQILNYQGPLEKEISDMKWKREDLERFIREIDDSACQATNILHRLAN